MAAEANMSTKTIQRLRQHNQQEIPLDTVVQLCIGLHAPPIISNYLLRAAGKSFMTTDLHIAYQLLLSDCYEFTLNP